ncbi:MAG: CHASE2 domain-containing protein [Candidatus Binataceae bacterium]
MNTRTLLGIAGRTVILGIATVAVIFAINSRHPALMEVAELGAGDLRMNSRRAPGPTGSVAIVEIDDDSIASIGRWPWSRGVFARLVSTLQDYKVAVIGMDILFTEPDDLDRDHQALAAKLAAAGVSAAAIATTLGPQNDAALADALAHQGSSYLAYFFGGHYFGAAQMPAVRPEFAQTIRNPPPVTFIVREAGPQPELFTANSYLPPLSVIAAGARGSAFVDVDDDADGVVRAIPAVIRFDQSFCVPLFLALVSAYQDHAPLVLWLTNSAIRTMVGRMRVPLDEMGRMFVDFRGRAGKIPSFSAADILARRVPEQSLKGKIVLVGLTGHGLGDRDVTPVGADVPGVEIQAIAVDNVLSGKFVRRSEVTEGETRLAALLLGLAITIAVSQLGAIRSAIAGVVLAAGYILYAQYRLQVGGAMLGVVLPLLTLVVTYTVLAGYRYTAEGLEKRRLRRAFVHYLPPTLVDRLAEDEAELKLGGEERTITVMFADLTGFTAASTKMTPEALTGKVNRYFDFIVRPIDESGGYVERFLGDAALAFWGAPVSDSRHAIRAVKAAFEIIEGVRRAREEDEARGELGFTIKVGINTGPAVVGNVGSRNRYSYTAMGEDVNLASRLEGIPPLYGCLIVAGERTARLAQEEFLMRELDWVLVKGATEPMTVYQPLAALDAASDAQRNASVRFAAALEHYRAARFAEACAIWDELVAAFEPAPSPSSIMADRARRFIATPPPKPWNAVFVLTSK